MTASDASRSLPEEPYRGVESFRYVDRDIFFEREKETDNLTRHVSVYRGVLLYGDSGSGKSSLINAGFIPAIQREGFIPHRLRVRPQRGEEIKVERISETDDGKPPYLPSIFTSAGDTDEKLLLSIEEFKERLSSAPQTSCPLLIFDQFEEFVTLFEVAPRGEKLEEARAAQAAILRVLSELLRDDALAVKLLFVFREDYLAKLNNLFVLYPDISNQYVRLVAPSTDRLLKIIRGPFERFPGRFSPEISSSLAEQLKAAFTSRNEAGPLLNLSKVQIACLQLWKSGHPDTLFKERGVKGLLDDYLSDALARFHEDLRKPAVLLLSRMVTPLRTRNVISGYDLINRVHGEDGIAQELLEEALQKLVNEAKLVRFESRHEAPFYEIISEFLIDWILRQKEELRVQDEQRRLIEQVKQAEVKGRDILLATKSGFSERDFAARVESMEADQFGQLLLRTTDAEERTLQRYFGHQPYKRLRLLAFKRHISKNRQSLRRRGNVVVIHGFMGSELATSQAGLDEAIWINLSRLSSGEFAKLRLADDGRTEENRQYHVHPTGVLKRYYGHLLLTLSENWNVFAFAYDWRKDLNLAAAELDSRISSWISDDAPLHIIAHSSGGLVARTFIKNYSRRWAAIWDKSSGGRLGGRLIMLGTPNHGSFVTLQTITGIGAGNRRLGLLDPQKNLKSIRETLISFPGIYHMLPSPLVGRNVLRFYHSKAYGDLNVPQKWLDNALKHHDQLSTVVDFERMVYIAGDNQITFGNIVEVGRLDSTDSYDLTKKGDGLVTHDLGLLKGDDGSAVKSYFVEESHSELARNPVILAAIDELLETGATAQLKDRASAGRGAQVETGALKEKMREQLTVAQSSDEHNLTGAPVFLDDLISEAERSDQEKIIRGFLGNGMEREEDAKGARLRRDPPGIELGLVWGGIEEVGARLMAGRKNEPVDAISTGHFSGVNPLGAELSLDQAISPGLSENRLRNRTKSELILTQYTERGIIRGELGQPFFFTDPRTLKRKSNRASRTIAIAGMGIPGRFGAPELTITVRELCWSLGQLGKQHLASVLIGSGTLSIQEAVAAWMKGIAQALSGAAGNKTRRLKRITFVENDPRRIKAIQAAIFSQRAELGDSDTLRISYKALTQSELKRLDPAISKWNREEAKRRQMRIDKSRSRIPIRVTINLWRGMYRVAAISETVQMPEREYPIDQTMVTQANNELLAEWNPERQLERGRFLEQLLIPEELRLAMASNAPIVMMLDAATSRIHWEAIAQIDSAQGRNLPGESRYGEDFLGTSRGFTRQLRTMITPPPEPPPPQRRILRVLVVADPAADQRLAGAEEEGAEVAELFESFNRIWDLPDNRVEVVWLSGPREATRTNVLGELSLHSYDVLHFVGHSIYNHTNPGESGWVFGQSEYLTANELYRIDRVPRFVFSNARESGVTPERAESRSVELAPSLAEAFFCKGVSNFVCAAWPVEDAPARRFAVTLYSNLLGLSETEDQPNRYERAVDGPEPMHIAMRRARTAIASSPSGIRTWAAYQHYGNPYLEFFDRERLQSRYEAAFAGPAHSSGAARSSSRRVASTRGRTSSAKKSRVQKTSASASGRRSPRAKRAAGAGSKPATRRSRKGR